MSCTAKENGLNCTHSYSMIGSAPTKEKLMKLIEEEFYAGTKMILNEDGSLNRASDNKLLEGVRVIQKKGRWRFEIPSR